MAQKVAATGKTQGSDRRQQILAIAAHLFATQGYTLTTVRDIADEAGILSGSLYHHFASKETIGREILLTFLDQLVERYRATAAEGLGPLETIESLVRVSFTLAQDEPDAVGLFYNEGLFLRSQMGFEFLVESSNEIEAIWLKQLRRGQESGQFRASLDLPMIWRFIRDSMWASVRWYQPGGRHTTESLAATFMDFVSHGIVTDTSRVR